MPVSSFLQAEQVGEEVRFGAGQADGGVHGDGVGPGAARMLVRQHRPSEMTALLASRAGGS
jgi:hypothetical protein